MGCEAIDQYRARRTERAATRRRDTIEAFRARRSDRLNARYATDSQNRESLAVSGLQQNSLLTTRLKNDIINCRNDDIGDDGGHWITINGASVWVEGGQLAGNVGKKIEATSKPAKAATSPTKATTPPSKPAASKAPPAKNPGSPAKPASGTPQCSATKANPKLPRPHRQKPQQALERQGERPQQAVSVTYKTTVRRKSVGTFALPSGWRHRRV